jgi:hypothetical protein
VSETAGVAPGAGDTCPLCSGRASFYVSDRFRTYTRCSVCGLITVPRQWHPSPEAERRRYDLHRNSPSDAGYVRFLSQLVDEVAPRLEPGGEGLDFGSGPSPVLASLMESRGFGMHIFDPFYANDRDALARTYGFVLCSEVVEHFRDPAGDWDRLASLVAPGGWLGVMTALWDGTAEGFVRWRYAKDETHLAFHCSATMVWVAARHGLEVEMAGRQVTLFRRPPDADGG